ncbi:uncharacterized protein ARMOST_08570 [Armillaria ostoyae]|uniref:Uncharacterized protein n=1 Tax=Armillaria ostoyae TaxID=47428 RepID=A0A284R8Z6_ARMOS|nr:uncharacterized protein ARMOST_08570 [Armillaria ostoyae]
MPEYVGRASPSWMGDGDRPEWSNGIGHWEETALSLLARRSKNSDTMALEGDQEHGPSNKREISIPYLDINADEHHTSQQSGRRADIRYGIDELKTSGFPGRETLTDSQSDLALDRYMLCSSWAPRFEAWLHQGLRR